MQPRSPAARSAWSPIEVRRSQASVCPLISSAEANGRTLDRYAASLLASGQDAANLAVAFTGHASEELRGCLVHELVLRGIAVAEIPGIARWATSSHWRRHPLGGLPLTRSDIESRSDLPRYSSRGSSHSMPFGPSESREPAVLTGVRSSSAQETTTEADATVIATAVANWAEESNGRIEARGFDLAKPLDPASVPAALLTPGLDCLRGAGKKAALSVTVLPPAQAWRVVFGAASSGGAYSRGSFGAYGRLAAWRSLAALAGCPEGATPDEVEPQVRDCVWHGFDADTKWFEQVAWDIGLAALAPDRRRLAVLAATDTD
ncbi:DUF6183 family protein [Streptomyces sp. NBC_00820]|uniref:DUF6183 family protein n=1 Tax=Streptomyces sp. NBC_00820 TaxID=2975842 RepID=UPI002ED696C9|nr:DUF6183 family protein [Streptomyces sp. NBC_00820]